MCLQTDPSVRPGSGQRNYNNNKIAALFTLYFSVIMFNIKVHDITGKETELVWLV